ncbi:Flagellar biosynthetic protein FliP [uncultured delta proteobacterium]|uniref:Flagellar biosynthetic protein FliP n=1 Tax=uncultured delta proteobacterium TaxID=34034 RepID=A0A212J6M0_9DELT|nr:Flagellar biosynthetic protein FliP [uncultured delta proteobacterium]
MKTQPHTLAQTRPAQPISRPTSTGPRKTPRKTPGNTPSPAAGRQFLLRAASVFFLTLFVCGGFLAAPSIAQAAEALTSSPMFQLSLAGGTAEPEQVSLGLEILFLLTVLSLAPAIILTVTSFTRIIIVFHFIRQALGVQQLPPNQVLVSLAIFMTVAIMYPVGKDINTIALQPYLEERIGFSEALQEAEKPLRTFLFKHTREKDLSIFYSITKMDRPHTKDDVPTVSLCAAFMISELKTGFIIGFLIYIPFLILDMVVSSILLAMGMMMLPPMMVSTPFKLLLFVMVDGWSLLVGSLVNSFFV